MGPRAAHRDGGGTLAHSLIASRLADAIRPGLRPGCTVFRANAKVLTTAGSRARYPDPVVTCAPFRPGELAVPAPVLIVEVLSESTSATDLGIKRQEYAALPSRQRHVILSNEERLAFVFARARDFAAEEVRDVLHLPEFDPSVPLAALYEGRLAD